MDSPPTSSIERYFGALPDPRQGKNVQHPLLSILSIAVCAVICGADTWVDVEMFGHAKQAWLERFLYLPYGIPSHDTFGRVFRWLNPDAFEACFRQWTQAVCALLDGEVVAAAEEERFTRVKNDRGFPAFAANYCLEEAGLQARDLAAVAFYESPALAFERLLMRLLTTPRMHGIHHSIVREETASNWSSGISWWDWLHGTIRCDVPQDAITIGVPAYQDPAELDLKTLLALPFLPQRDAWQPTWRRSAR